MKRFLVIIALLVFTISKTYAQQGFVVSGGDISARGTVSFSVGQLEYQYFRTGNYLVIEGLQQPYEITKPLPISLLYFTARVGENNTVRVNWSTVFENNNDYFSIERSKDGRNFQKIGEVKSKGDNNTQQEYSFIDQQPLQGSSFYRLKQTDKDGKFSYSIIEKVHLKDPGLHIVAGPNPTRNIVQLNISGTITPQMHFKLLDLNGKKILEEKIKSNHTIVDLSTLAQAVYLLQITDGNKIVQIFRIVKQ